MDADNAGKVNSFSANPQDSSQIDTTSDLTNQPNIVIADNSNEKKFGKPFVSLRNLKTKFKEKWMKIPKKLKIISVALSIILVSITVLSSLKNIKPGDLKNIGRKEVSVAEFGDWQKMVIPQRQKPFFTLAATTLSKYGILPNEVLVLKTEKPFDINLIKESIIANVPIAVSALTNQEFKITPQRNLGLEEVLSVKLNVEDKEFEGYKFDRDYSWAYQSQGKFRVVSSIPGDKKTEVPVNTGIEIAFSQDDFKDPTAFISVSPTIRFRTEIHAERFVVVPLDPLNEKTVYTVTLKKGLSLKSRNDPITEDYTFTFQTKEKEMITRPPFFSLSEDFQQISPEEHFLTKVYTSNWNSDNTIKAEVYKFLSSDSFLASRKSIDEIQGSWMTYYSEDEAVDVSQLEKVMSTDLKVQNKDRVDYLELPDNLAQGFYLVQFWSQTKDRLEQIWLQSTDITGFVSVGKEQTVVWANYLKGGPVQNAIIRFTGLAGDYRTYDNGTSVFSTPQILFDGLRHYAVITDDTGKEVILPVTTLKGNHPPGKITSNDYWSYLYNERYLYKPGDTVYFFGVIKSRATNQAPSQVEVILRNSDYSEKGEILTKTISPSSDGSFMDNFRLDAVPLGWYNLILKVNDVEVESSSFSVTQYEKPEMKIEVTADKKAIFTDEKVKYSTKITFFDGTPAGNIPIKVYQAKDGKSSDLTTGENGELDYTYETKYNEASYIYYPRYETVTFTPAIAQEQKIEGFGSVYVYGSKLMISSESDQDGHTAKLKAKVRNVDLTKINSGEGNNVEGSPAADKDVSLKIKKTWYEKKDSGTYYDFIEKVTRKTYSYIRHEETVDDKKVKTDGEGAINYDFQLEEGKSYVAELEVKDVDNHPAKTSQYYYYHTEAVNYGDDQKDFPQLNLDKEESTYSLGEEVKLNIVYGDSEYPDTADNRFLFIIANRGKQEVILTDGPSYSFSFDQKYVPNIYIGSYIFTGKSYNTVSAPCRRDWYCSDYFYYGQQNYFNGFMISYKSKDSELSLTISPDKEKYQPGEEAKVSVEVKKGDNPVSGASVNLVLVDEALAALDAVRKPSILSSLYQSVQSLIYYNYSSHEPIFPDESQAEKGGGGGGDRDIFKDAAFFGRELTDDNGIASFAFILPDNITTWIAYAQAVNQNIDAGQQEGRVVATKDFFVTSQFPAEYLLKDKPFATGGSFGKGLSPEDKVDFKAIFFDGDKEISNLGKETNAYRSIIFPFPVLGVGDYKVSVRGKVGDLEDGIKLPFKVISSRLIFDYFKKYDLIKGQVINSAEVSDVLEDKPARLVVSDKGRGTYYADLARYCFTGSNRIEKQLAQLSAANLLVKRFDDDFCKVDKEALKKFQNFDGGLSQVSWGGSDLSTTVWALSIDGNPFSEDPAQKEKMISYFESKLSEGGGGNLQKIYASWGLTKLGKPKVNELQVLQNFISTYEEKVTLAMALIAADDSEKARDLYYDILADYAYDYSPYIRIQAELKGKSQVDSYVENTSSALLLGSFVEKTYDEGLYNYVRDFRPNVEDVVIDLSIIAFIDDQLAKLPDEDTRISFVSAHQNVQKELTKGKSIAIPLQASELNSFRLQVLEGKAEAFFSYFVGPEGLAKLPTDKLLSIKRNYKKVKGDGSSIKTGDIVEVRIDFNLDFAKSPTGCYTITDHLPSGLKYMSNPSDYGLSAEGWVSEKENNIIEGFFCNSLWWQQHGKKYMVYFARAGSVGDYEGEPAIIQSQRYLTNFQKTDGQIIKIEGSNLGN